MLNIAFLVEFYYPRMGGVQKRFHELGKRLASKGHTVHVFTIRYKETLPRTEEMDGLTIHRFMDGFKYLRQAGRSLLGFTKFFLRSPIEIRMGNFDVCYSSSNPQVFHSLPLKISQVPVVQSWNEIYPSQYIFSQPQKLTGKIIKYHIAESLPAYKDLINKLGVSPKNIAYIPNGINIKQLQATDVEVERGKLSYIGRLVYYKRPDLLIKAFKILKRRISSIELHIAGKGPFLPRVKKLAEKDEGIKCLGFISEREKVQLLNSTEVFLFPSQREGFGISALEALATGTPVITTRFPNNATKRQFSGGVLPVPPTPKAIAKKTQQLIENKSLWLKMQKEAYNEAKQYDWDNSASKLEDFFLHL